MPFQFPWALILALWAGCVHTSLFIIHEQLRASWEGIISFHFSCLPCPGSLVLTFHPGSGPASQLTLLKSCSEPCLAGGVTQGQDFAGPTDKSLPSGPAESP